MCKCLVSCQSASEVDPIHVDVVCVAFDCIEKHWNEILLSQNKILASPVTHVANDSTQVIKSHTTADLESVCLLKSYDDIEGTTTFFSDIKGKCGSFYFFLICGFRFYC